MASRSRACSHLCVAWRQSGKRAPAAREPAARPAARAGSVITREVPDGALAVERTEQRTVLGYDERKRAKKAGAVRKKGRAQGKNGTRGKGGPRGG